MRKTILGTATYGVFVFLSFLPFCAHAGCYYSSAICANPPAPQEVGYRVNQNTSIDLASQSPNPINSLSSEILNITVPRVSTTSYCYQPGYWVGTWYYYYDFSGGYCSSPYNYVGSYNYYGSNTTAQPTGTAAIQQNGVTVGSAAINTATTTYTTPPVQAAGSLSFVAQFTPTSGSGFSSATSSSLIVFSQLDPSLLAVINNLLLGD